MRTFPRELARFREIVNNRGGKLRQLSYEALEEHAAGPIEHLDVDSRSATIAIIVQPIGDGKLRVVLQGVMKHRLLPGKSVALDGFYKHRDGTVAAMPHEEFYEFD
jgi:hypothetical protein